MNNTTPLYAPYRITLFYLQTKQKYIVQVMIQEQQTNVTT